MEDSPTCHPRVVSLLPAATEIAAALGLRPHLVGRSHECDVPADVESLPAVTASRIDTSGPSRAIHEQVVEAGRAAGAVAPAAGAACGTGGSAPLFTLDIDTLAALAPDVILTQAACDVCAIAAADVEAAVRRAGVPTTVVSLAPARLTDLFTDILAVGRATGRLARARELVARLRARIASLACRAGTFPDRPRVAVIEWLDPPMAAGNWVPEMVALAGGIDVLGTPGGHSHWVSWADVARADPDVVVLVPCGLTLDRVVAEAGAPAVRSHLEPLRAFRSGRVHAVDGHHLFNRPGPRLVDSLEVLAEILHPGRFAFPSRFVRRLPAGPTGAA
ncbi:MAG: cobalamin-binding protein [Planctomycetia bacterium]|nr:cobalamin-binding protein [Planctomycetia bacterium]